MSRVRLIASVFAVYAFAASNAFSDGTGGIEFEGEVVPFPPPVQPVLAPNYSRSLPEEASAARPIHVVSEPGASWAINGLPRTGITQNPADIVMPFGELRSASLLYGFNSDDPVGMPIFAQMWDINDNGRPGAFHGAVLRGGVEYSDFNASIIFSTARFPDGSEMDIEAIAVAGHSGTTGVAQKVNKHKLARYGSLFLAGLIEGVGEVGLTRLAGDSDNTTIVIGNDSSVTSDDELSDGEILAGALRPVGENLSSAAEKNFDRKATISAEPGMGFAIVFTKSITAKDIAEARK